MRAEHAFYRETWAEVDLDAIQYNIKQMKQLLPESSQVMAVVKANGYGHGAIEVAKKALDAGATFLAVALLEEALILREAGIEAPILVLSWVPPESAYIAAENNITLTFFQKEWLIAVNSYKLEKDLMVHMKWDTGMGRVGTRTDIEMLELLGILKTSEHVRLTGVYTHFATADEADLTYFHEQKDHFKKLLTLFQENWQERVAIHIGNSAASIRFPEEMYHYIRFGIAMYGLYPSETVKKSEAVLLKQAFSLHSRLVHVKPIHTGDSIGYGVEHVAKGNEWVGTIPIGYGDGWIRKLKGIDVLVEGRRFPIIGRICMDQTMIQLDKDYPIGTKVTLIGSQETETISMDEVANYVDTINYEIPCIINNRVPRVYI